MNCKECEYFWTCPERSNEEDNICSDFCYDEEFGEKEDLPCWNCNKGKE
jgi:hypothetical protein